MKKSRTSSLFEWLDAMICALACVMLVFIFVFKVYTVSGSSMDPTLVSGSRIIAVSAFYTPRQNDIIVVDKNGPYGESLVKRIIATEGQTVNIESDGRLTVDGATIDVNTDNIHGDTAFPLTVPDGCCFVMGDNRSVSYDSRYTQIGFINNTYVVGHVVYVLTPASKAGSVK